jgi:hypothetical protein
MSGCRRDFDVLELEKKPRSWRSTAISSHAMPDVNQRNLAAADHSQFFERQNPDGRLLRGLPCMLESPQRVADIMAAVHRASYTLTTSWTES